MAERRSSGAPGGATLARRLHSLFGVAPVGAFLVFHLATNAASLQGADAYDAMTRRLQSLPLVIAVEVLVIAVPLFFHGIYGLFRIATDVPDPRPSPARRALTISQQMTGVGVFAFVLFHLWTARLVQIHDHGSLDLFRLMQAALASPWIRAAYVVGILSATFHLSAGLFTFAETWNLAVSPRARRFLAFGSGILFVGLSAVGLWTISAFRL